MQLFAGDGVRGCVGGDGVVEDYRDVVGGAGVHDIGGKISLLIENLRRINELR